MRVGGGVSPLPSGGRLDATCSGGSPTVLAAAGIDVGPDDRPDIAGIPGGVGMIDSALPTGVLLAPAKPGLAIAGGGWTAGIPVGVTVPRASEPVGVVGTGGGTDDVLGRAYCPDCEPGRANEPDCEPGRELNGGGTVPGRGGGSDGDFERGAGRPVDAFDDGTGGGNDGDFERGAPAGSPVEAFDDGRPPDAFAGGRPAETSPIAQPAETSDADGARDGTPATGPLPGIPAERSPAEIDGTPDVGPLVPAPAAGADGTPEIGPPRVGPDAGTGGGIDDDLGRRSRCAIGTGAGNGTSEVGFVGSSTGSCTGGGTDSGLARGLAPRRSPMMPGCGAAASRRCAAGPGEIALSSSAEATCGVRSVASGTVFAASGCVSAASGASGASDGDGGGGNAGALSRVMPGAGLGSVVSRTAKSDGAAAPRTVVGSALSRLPSVVGSLDETVVGAITGGESVLPVDGRRGGMIVDGGPLLPARRGGSGGKRRPHAAHAVASSTFSELQNGQNLIAGPRTRSGRRRLS
jgi:hypothetical protein